MLSSRGHKFCATLFESMDSDGEDDTFVESERKSSSVEALPTMRRRSTLVEVGLEGIK